MDAADTIYWLLLLGLRHDRLRGDDHHTAHTFVFGTTWPSVWLTVWLAHIISDPYIFHMCLIVGRSPYWIGIWLSQV